MKKGFTLIELIGALAILSILALVAVPAIQNAINNSNDTIYQAQIDSIIDASKNWVADHIEKLPKKDNDKIGVTLLELKKGGYIDKKIKNPKTGQPFSDDLLVVITKEKETFLYEVKQESDFAPTLLLIGSENVYLNYGQEYQEPGVIAKTNSGEEIEDVTTIIKKDDEVVEEIDSNQFGVYTITYQVSDNGVVVTLKRNVHIFDNEPPIILFEEETVLDITVRDFDSLNGVIAEDNGGERVRIEVTGNLTLGIPGTYELTYKASDNFGNTSQKTRTIKIITFQQEFLFPYKGLYDSFSAKVKGIYKIELWGAQGGNSVSKGAYTSGNILLEKGQTLYVYVGQGGITTNNITSFNGGTGNSGGTPGGGATDIRTYIDPTGAWDDFDSLKSRIMVAAGSGSGVGNNTIAKGYGGTLTGGTGGGTSGGTQTSAGARQSTSYLNSGFGFASGGCAGGGGYYGGGGSTCVNGAGGGSSFISGYTGCDAISKASTSTNIIHTGQANHYSGLIFTKSVMIAGNEEMPNHDGTGKMTGNAGNGYAKITLLEMKSQ